MPIYLGKDRIVNAGLGNIPVSSITQAGLQIGDFFQGGYIFYFNDASKKSGLIAGSKTALKYIFGCAGTSISTSTAIGTGQSNTNNILAGCVTRPIAASVADSYSDGGYSDFYLPSRGECEKILEAQIATGFNFGFVSGQGIQTSSQESATVNTWVSFIGGGVTYTSANKAVDTEVIPIRSFSS
jgi:hypothetical protein